jgi:hypothetical protein
LVALHFNCETKVCEFHRGPFALARQQKVFRLEKGKILVFLSTVGDGQDFAKKHQRTTPIESPEFLCNEICFNWCMAFFYQLLPKIFSDNLSLDLLLQFLIS